jgi:ABC-2 type transport system ATP-binding protein
LIRTEALSKTYGSVQAVSDLNLDVPAGSIFGFLGPNGAGKTTTLRMLTGLLKPTSGSVSVAGLDVRTHPTKVKQVIGYLPDNPFVYDHLTIAEFLTFVGDIYQVKKKQLHELGERYLRLFELEGRSNQRASELSLGMRKKVALAALLVREPQVLFLDEPTSGLDPKAVKELRDLLANLASSGMTIFFSTHILEVAQRISHTIGIINGGRMVACGNMEELREKAHAEDRDLEEIFLSLTESETPGKQNGVGQSPHH